MISNFSIAQEGWDEALKSENGCVIEQSQHVEISINEDGTLNIIDKVYEETQHFTANANFYSEQSIGYSSTFSEIYDIDAYSLIPTEKGRYKKIQVEDFITSDARSSGIFYDDQKKISYVFPALGEGSKTIISYTKQFKEPRLWGYFMFSSFFPVEKSTYTVKVPEHMKLKFHQFQTDGKKVTFTEKKKGKHKIFSWTAEKISRIQLSKGSEGLLHSAPHLIIYIDSYEHNGIKHNVLGEVEDLHAWYQNFLHDIENDENEEMKIMVENIVAHRSTELEKVEAIYDWVQQNVKYIAIEDGLGGFRPRSSSLVFKRRYGDCKDMSNLIHNMLTIAEIPSNLSWIGTKAIPYKHTEVPTPMADNHMICTYVNNGQYYFLDATDQYNTLGIPTSHIQGREALINKGVNEFELVEVPVVSYETNRTIDSVNFWIDGNKVRGSGKAIYSGYTRIPIANGLVNLGEHDRRTFLNQLLKKGNNKFRLDGVSIQNLSAKSEDLVIDYEFSLEDYLYNFSNEMIINPYLSKDFEGDFIDTEKYKEPVQYPYKKLKSKVYTIQIPEGFNASFVPLDTKYENDLFGFNIDYKVTNEVIVINQDVMLNTLQVDQEDFDAWNEMIKGLLASYGESIVFKENED